MKYGDLFSGIGCVAQALKKLGIEYSYEFACDIDIHCKTNLTHNFDVKKFYTDVKTITDLPKVDLFTAGFPCQPFSAANRTTSRGKDHPKYDLFTETVRCLKLCDPEIWILENVAGLTHRNNKEYFNYICTTLDSLQEWNWDYRVMNSKDYGTPQSRNRIYFIGCKKALPRFPEKSSIINQLHNIIDMNIPLDPFINNSKNNSWKGLEHNVMYIDNGQTSGLCHKFRKFETQKWVYCLTASAVVCLYMLNEKGLFRRKLTLNEIRQLQNINPDFENICSEPQFRKQIGNGMDVSIMAKLIECQL